MAEAPCVQKMQNGVSKGFAEDELMTQQEKSPAYRVLHEHGLLSSQFRIMGADEIEGFQPNSYMWKNTMLRGCLCACGVVPGMIDCCFNSQFEVSDGHVRQGKDRAGRFFFFL